MSIHPGRESGLVGIGKDDSICSSSLIPLPRHEQAGEGTAKRRASAAPEVILENAAAQVGGDSNVEQAISNGAWVW